MTLKTITCKTRQIQTKVNLINYLLPTAKLYAQSGKHDDRILFLNSMRLMYQFLRVADTVYGKDTLLDCAINQKFSEEYELLKEIEEKFKGRELV